FFFFQAEDGIRDFHVTGVQTCALPIWKTAKDKLPTPGGRSILSVRAYLPRRETTMATGPSTAPETFDRSEAMSAILAQNWWAIRSEERRVGKEGRARWSAARYRTGYVI